MKIDKKILWESVKEPLRLLVLAIIPFGLAYLTDLPNWWAILGTLILRWIDKYLHEFAPAGKAGGLTGF